MIAWHSSTNYHRETVILIALADFVQKQSPLSARATLPRVRASFFLFLSCQSASTLLPSAGLPSRLCGPRARNAASREPRVWVSYRVLTVGWPFDCRLWSDLVKVNILLFFSSAFSVGVPSALSLVTTRVRCVLSPSPVSTSRLVCCQFQCATHDSYRHWLGPCLSACEKNWQRQDKKRKENC